MLSKLLALSSLAIASAAWDATEGKFTEMPPAPTGYTANDNNDYDNGNAGEWIWKDASATDNMAACTAKCEETNGCCGFNYQYAGNSVVNRCVGKKNCGGTMLTSRFNMAFYLRDSAVSGQTEADTTADEVKKAFANAAAAATGMATGLLIAVIVVPIISIVLLVVCIVCCCKHCNKSKA